MEPIRQWVQPRTELGVVQAGTPVEQDERMAISHLQDPETGVLHLDQPAGVRVSERGPA
jgi:hypothetical protein